MRNKKGNHYTNFQLSPKTLFILMFLIGLVWSCNPAKKFSVKGDQLANAGDYENATSYYYTALLKDKNYLPAQNGLKINAQKVLNDKIEVFRKQVLNNQLEEAIKQYQASQKFYSNANSVNVQLDWPTEYDEVFADIKSEYSGKKFIEVIQLINDKKFDVAERQLQELATLDTSYRSVSVLRMHSVLEPLYIEAMRQYNHGKYQESYITFNKILDIDDQFKDAKTYRDKSLMNATTRYGVLPVITEKSELRAMFNDYLSQQVNATKMPFVNIVDFKKMSGLIEGRGWGEMKNTNEAIQAGKSLGFQYLVYLNLKVLIDTLFPTTQEKKTAYESFTENIPNPYTDTYSYITKFKKVTYNDVSSAQRLKYGVNVAILNCIDGTTVYSDYFEANKLDELHKLEFTGNVNNLYQNLPDGNYLPPENKEWREQFTGTKRKLLDKSTLQKQLLIDLAVETGFKLKKIIK